MSKEEQDVNASTQATAPTTTIASEVQFKNDVVAKAKTRCDTIRTVDWHSPEFAFIDELVKGDKFLTDCFDRIEANLKKYANGAAKLAAIAESMVRVFTNVDALRLIYALYDASVDQAIRLSGPNNALRLIRLCYKVLLCHVAGKPAPEAIFDEFANSVTAGIYTDIGPTLQKMATDKGVVCSGDIMSFEMFQIDAKAPFMDHQTIVRCKLDRLRLTADVSIPDVILLKLGSTSRDKCPQHMHIPWFTDTQILTLVYRRMDLVQFKVSVFYKLQSRDPLQLTATTTTATTTTTASATPASASSSLTTSSTTSTTTTTTTTSTRAALPSRFNPSVYPSSNTTTTSPTTAQS